MYDLKINPAFCQNINQVHLYLVYYGRGEVDKRWSGSVFNPIYSRLFYIASGRACITVNKTQQIYLEAGNWYLLPAGCSFSYSCDDRMDHLYFHFRLNDIDGIDLFHQCPLPCSIQATKEDLDFFTEGLDCHTIYESLKIRQRVYDILLTLMKQHKIALVSRKLSPCVTKAIHYIQKNLSVQLTTGKIAEHCQVCISTLNNHFKSELNMTVSEYIDNLVFSETTRLLRESDLSVMEISEKAGFSDQFYFSRRFKEKMGTSPLRYRKTFV